MVDPISSISGLASQTNSVKKQSTTQSYRILNPPLVDRIQDIYDEALANHCECDCDSDFCGADALPHG